jgi:uncharacterized iron-regulated membrane protein
MKRFNYKFYLRKAHRYLGLFIGIQFLFWTIGGLYFSWTKIEEIRGDHLRNKAETIKIDGTLISPQPILDQIREKEEVAGVARVNLIEILEKPFYEIRFLPAHGASHQQKIVVASALDATIRPAVTKAEAEKIAAAALLKPLAVKESLYLTPENIGGHHEYRSGALPAWAITFDSPDELTVYVAAENGQVGSFRTNEWRAFDFLWMLHTMDYRERDNINNYILRGFSILGMITILSGFLLFFASSPLVRRLVTTKTPRPKTANPPGFDENK